MQFARALLLTLFTLPAVWATDLTGTFHKPDGTPVSGKLIFLLSQPARLSDSSAQVVPMIKIFTVSNGQLEPGAFIYGNDVLVPAGTHYLVRLVDNNNNLLFEQKWSIQGATLDLGTMTPTTTGVVLPDPLVKNTATSQAVQGPVTFSGGITTASLILSGNLGPSADSTFDLGTGTSRWREVHAERWGGVVSPGTSSGLVTPTASAPQLAQESATGGSIADGTYYCVTTGVNLNGETTPSPQQSLVISAGTGTAQLRVRVTGNELLTGAPWFKAYCGTTDGGPYFLQTPRSYTFTMDNNTVKRRPSSVSVSGSASRSSNVVSITTSSQHNMNPGETFVMSGCSDSTYNGTVTVATAPTNTTLTYFKVGSDGSTSNCTVTPQLGNFVTLTLTGTSSLGVSDGKLITVAGATGCTDNPNGTFRVYSHTAVASPASSSITFKHTGAAESGCGGSAITVTWDTGFVAGDVGTATNLINSHLFRGDIILTSVAGSGSQPPTSNTAAIDDVQVAVNASRNLTTWIAGQTNRTWHAVQLGVGNDINTNGPIPFYALTTPLVLSDGDRLLGVGGVVLDQPAGQGTSLRCYDSGTGFPVNPLWTQVYDNIGCVMIINTGGTEVERVSIDSHNHSVFIYQSEGDAEANNNIRLAQSVFRTTGTGANCPAALRIHSRIYYFEANMLSLVPSTTTDCFAANGWPRGAALMMSIGAGSEWVFKGPVRWTVPAKHDFIQNRKGPTDPDRGVNRSGFPNRNSLVFQNMGHLQGTAGGGTGIPCRCENTMVNFMNSPGAADYTVSAGADPAWIFGTNSYGSTGPQTFLRSNLSSHANNAATVRFTSSGPRLELMMTAVSNAAPVTIDFNNFEVPVLSVLSGNADFCDPRATNFANRVTAPTSGSGQIACFGSSGGNTADRREGPHLYVQGGAVQQGWCSTPGQCRQWTVIRENSTFQDFYYTDADTTAQRYQSVDLTNGNIDYYAADGSTVVARLDKTNNQWSFPRSTGTQPFAVTSTTEIANLNSQLWRGKQALDFSAALDFASIAAQACAELTIAVSGASASSPIAPSWPAALETGLVGNMRISAANTVTVRLCNVTSGAIDPASGTFAGRVIQ